MASNYEFIQLFIFSPIKPSLSSFENGPWGNKEEGAAAQSSSLTPLALHITPFSSAWKTGKAEETKKKRNPESDKIKREGERETRGGHVLINKWLISTKLITGS